MASICAGACHEKLADADTLHRVYSALLSELLPASRRLSHRGLAVEQWTVFRSELLYRQLERGGRAKAVAKLIEAGYEQHFPSVPGFVIREKDDNRYWTLAGPAGMLIPVRDIEGRIVAVKIRCTDASGGGKYKWFTSRRKGQGVSPGTPVHVFLGENNGTVRVGESPLKADVASLVTGTKTIGLPGVGLWNRAASVLKSLGASRVLIAFDGDCRRNPHVAAALEGLYVTP